jgi:hypothetical protein|tara:strand:- start:584 stop:1033 length:450 start_codon:yes stop_codon:yes gene_type:complete
MSKILTDELIENRLRKINVLPIYEDLTHEYKLEKIQNHFDFIITSNWPRNPDIMFYTETTADGYEVWVATDDDQRPSITDDIYYYEGDWLEKMEDAMTDGAEIYFQELDDDNYEFKDIVDNVYEEYFNDKKQEIENELIEEGYEYEDEN